MNLEHNKVDRIHFPVIEENNKEKHLKFFKFEFHMLLLFLSVVLVVINCFRLKVNENLLE